MRKSFTYLSLLVLAVLINFQTSAQENIDDKKDEDLYEMSLEDLMQVEVEVASKSKKSLRESPGIISVVTADQIQQMGARDLIDVLRMVPGFQFGTDVQGAIGAGIRGNWAHEGKMSLQIDGQEINETLFSTNQFGQHFPVDNIERIEIIRGPGSALYGGYAELGVVNIITKKADDLEGVAFATSASEMESTYGQRNMSLMYGDSLGDYALSIHGFVNAGNRSERNYTGFYGGYGQFATYSMENNSAIKASNFNFALNKDQFKNRLIIDQYSAESRDAFDVISPKYTTRYNSLMWKTEYGFEATDKLTITPEVKLKKQTPWNVLNEKSKPYGLFLNVETQRITAETNFNYDFNEKINLMGGIAVYHERASARDTLDYFQPRDTLNPSRSVVDYMNYAFYLQGEFKTQWATFLAGARVEENSAVGASFVPRFAITKAFDKLHFKALASQAFRSPGISNIDANRVALAANVEDVKKIKSEKTTVFEIEAGYQLSDQLVFTANLFDITIKDPIVYSWAGLDVYSNYDKTGSRGFEADVRFKNSWVNANLTYSHYMQGGKNKVSAYEVPANFDHQSLLGFARDKVTLYASFDVMENLSVTPWLIYTGEKYGWAPEYNESDEIVWSINNKFDPTLQFNLFVNYTNLFVEKLTLGAGVYNLLNEEMYFVQPYDGLHAAIPGSSRSYRVKLSYNLF